MKKILLLGVLLLSGLSTFALPHYGDVNQPYDRLPGTLETYHIKWAKPLPQGKIKTLMIIPYWISREAVELGQRLDMDLTFIMNVGNSIWDIAEYEGDIAQPIAGTEAREVVKKITKERLIDNPEKFDVIILAKTSWEILPKEARQNILKRVNEGAALVYFSPNRLKPGKGSRSEVTEPDQDFQEIISNQDPEAAKAVLRDLPLDVLPLQQYKDRAGIFAAYNGQPRNWTADTSPVAVYGNRYGTGRIIAVDYADAHLTSPYASGLSFIYRDPTGWWNDATYDYGFAIACRAILYAVGTPKAVTSSIVFQAPKTELTAPANDRILHSKLVIDRYDLAKSSIEFQLLKHIAESQEGSLAFSIRSRDGKEVFAQNTPFVLKSATSVVSEKLPMLSRGDYLADLRVLDQNGKVLDFASAAFRVESAFKITALSTKSDRYPEGSVIQGDYVLSRGLKSGENVKIFSVDTWGRTTAIINVEDKGSFAIKVEKPLSRLWDIVCVVSDKDGVVDSKKIWVGIPNWTFDDYMTMLIFAPQPGTLGWKGELYSRLVRKYGINSVFSTILYGSADAYEHNERAHMASISYMDHLGEREDGLKCPADKENTKLDTGAGIELLDLYVKNGGNPIDPKIHTYSHHGVNAQSFNKKLELYDASAKFGSPLYIATGENYLAHEFNSKENSGFAPVTTRMFQDWCKKEYKNDLNELNNEWNTSFKSWDEVRGILFKNAVAKNQLPRWVDFRYFMRSEIWSGFFVKYSEYAQTKAPKARTGRVGHDHYDFSKFRDQMYSSKVYIGQEYYWEWVGCMMVEILQSFGNDKGFFLGSQSMIRWTCDLDNPISRKRLAWGMLFMGLNGFDWEQGLISPSLGGVSCFTADYSEPLPYFLEVFGEVQKIQRGIGKLTINSKPVRSQVAISWSPRNHYISRLIPFQDRAFSGSWLFNISVVQGAPDDCLTLLNSLRIRPTFIAPEDTSDLAGRGYKALFLPYNKGMSEAEAQAIRDFVKDGGIVFADNEPGTYSEHGKELTTPRLKDLFPTFKEVKVTSYGKGKAIYLAGLMNSYQGRMLKGDFKGSDLIEELLAKYASVRTPLMITGKDGLPMRNVRMAHFKKNGTELIGLLRPYKNGDKVSDDPFTLKFEKESHIYDAINQKYLGKASTLEVKLGPLPMMLALTPAKVENVSLSATSKVIPGNSVDLAWNCEFNDAAAGKQFADSLHLEVVAPNGELMECYTHNYIVEGSQLQVSLPIALNSVFGKYTVKLTSAVTGKSAQNSFIVGEDK